MLPQLYTVVIVPSAVYNEVVIRGKEQNHLDAYVVELAIAGHALILLPSPELNPFEVLHLRTEHGVEKGSLLSSDWELSDAIQHCLSIMARSRLSN